MIIILTVGEIQDIGFWEAFCEKREIDVYAVVKGMLSRDDDFFHFLPDELNDYGVKL